MIDALASAEHLAVVSDFDGTLAGFARNAYDVRPEQRSLDALASLAALPRTTAAVLSGRHLEGLKRVCPLREPVLFGGSHGAESSWEESSLSPEIKAHLAKKEEELKEIIARHPGAELEVKPFQRVLHLRALELQDPDAAAAAYAEGAALSADGFPKTEGKCVVEFSATQATKGTWIEKLRQRVGATAVVFLGDDTTDEDGFAVLNQPPDLGVKVGEGATQAALRLPDIAAVTEFLEELASARAQHSS
ncbi:MULTISPECIES: trehalose-phosphatase [Corynebacterium]|uniref:Trehalose 6-phosphate phosphatase n=1 Tax=Corynebacterium intestinale TaxID=2943492 RepID=A0ABT0TAG4_9CORY|nr:MULTISPECIES: trehalose-phosphatase [Corynebacterium]MCL8494083.1 trehalose-phosphatase [Corynebacterium intestinale]MCP1390319.1 trehalose-phosphatase [Corynebacterium intestinale]MTD97996.1 trehalose-phosphatase [Corynebacterium guaraldiae]